MAIIIVIPKWRQKKQLVMKIHVIEKFTENALQAFLGKIFDMIQQNDILTHFPRNF